MGPTTLTPGQLADYERDGFILLKGALSDAEISRLESGLAANPPLDGTLYDVDQLNYPEPGRYTLANSCLADPDLAFLAEHPTVTGAAADALGDDPRLTAYVIYERTPGGAGIRSHNDYKRWRPVGSSMNWLFTITPFCDFDAAAGRLWLAPGSHRLDRIRPGGQRPLEVDPAVRPPEEAYIDPGIERGDLVLMNMHTWHRADGNQADHSRTGAFNKYAAASAPPATGYFLYNDAVADALSPEGRSVVAVHSDLAVTTTRLLLTKGGPGTAPDELDVLLVEGEDGKLCLPGGEVFIETAIADWDRGNYIAALQHHLRRTLRIETPWVSYIGDEVEQRPGGSGLCRIYGYDLTGEGFPVAYDGAWLNRRQLAEAAAEGKLSFGYEAAVFEAWVDPTITRGKGLTQAQSRVDQYAY